MFFSSLKLSNLAKYLLLVCFVLFIINKNGFVNCDNNIELDNEIDIIDKKMLVDVDEHRRIIVKRDDNNNDRKGLLEKIIDKKDQLLGKKSDDDHKSDQEDDDDSKEIPNAKEEKEVREIIKTNFNFIHAFFASLSVIVVSEIGDKTFFIAAIMAMKHSRFTVYSGAMLALGLMTLLSALLGNILTKVLPKKYTYYASSILFALFGLKMMREAYQMSDGDAQEEYDEANSTLKESEERNSHIGEKADLELGGGQEKGSTQSMFLITRRYVVFFRKYLSTVLIQAFILTFLAEWGDRSQISTIILAARENMIGTVLGGTFGHGLCTGLAVLGGRFIAQRISVKRVTLVGAFVFLFFAFSAFFMDPDSI
jgi:putative Ca2+/H+ antiporter (TMEM165/GDT1 family)